MKTNIKKAYHPDEFRQQGHQLIDLLADYLEHSQNRQDIPISALIEPRKMLEQLQNDFSQPTSEPIAELFRPILEQTTHLQHPRYVGHQVSSPIPMSGLAEMVTGVTNASGSIYEMSASGAAMDKIVVDFLLQKCGFGESANGILTSGGSLGNLTALLAARQAMSGYDAWEEGVKGDLAIMVSEESHYSVSRAVKIMGLGEKGMVKIPTTKDFKIDASKLAESYQQALKQGKKIIAVIGNACSTSTGSFDDLEALAAFCKKHGLWFHVDAAHGGGLLLSDKYKHLLKGIEKADSAVIDFHKMMLFPSLVTAVLFQNGQTSIKAFSQKADYLAVKEDENDWSDSINRTIECTRPMMGMRVYTVLRKYGAQAIGQYVTDVIDLTKQFAALIEASPGFEIATPPSCNILCFRYSPSKDENTDIDINSFNAKLRLAMLQDGRFYIVQTTIRGQIYLRTALMNPFTTLKDLKELLEKLRELAKSLTVE